METWSSVGRAVQLRFCLKSGVLLCTKKTPALARPCLWVGISATLGSFFDLTSCPRAAASRYLSAGEGLLRLAQTEYPIKKGCRCSCVCVCVSVFVSVCCLLLLCWCWCWCFLALSSRPKKQKNKLWGVQEKRDTGYSSTTGAGWMDYSAPSQLEDVGAALPRSDGPPEASEPDPRGFHELAFLGQTNASEAEPELEERDIGPEFDSYEDLDGDKLRLLDR